MPHALNILHKTIKINKYNIYGCSLVTAYNLSKLVSVWDNITCNREAEIIYYNNLPKDVDILLSHSPPSGKLGFDSIYDVDIGSKELRKYIENNSNLKLVICGHKHVNKPEIEIINNTIIINIVTQSQLIKF